MRFESKTIAIFLGSAGLAGTVAAADAKPPLKVVQGLVDDIRSFARPKEDGALTPIQQRENQRIVESVHGVLDFEGLAERSLGSTWDSLKPKERQEFLELLRRIFAEVAYPQSSKFFGELDLEYDDVGERDDRHVVAIAVSHPDEGLIDLEFFLDEVDGEWKVVDLHMDMVSLALDIRALMQKIISDDGYDELIRRMKSKLEEESVVTTSE